MRATIFTRCRPFHVKRDNATTSPYMIFSPFAGYNLRKVYLVVFHVKHQPPSENRQQLVSNYYFCFVTWDSIKNANKTNVYFSISETFVNWLVSRETLIFFSFLRCSNLAALQYLAKYFVYYSLKVLVNPLRSPHKVW